MFVSSSSILQCKHFADIVCSRISLRMTHVRAYEISITFWMQSFFLFFVVVVVALLLSPFCCRFDSNHSIWFARSCTITNSNIAIMKCSFACLLVTFVAPKNFSKEINLKLYSILFGGKTTKMNAAIVAVLSLPSSLFLSFFLFCFLVVFVLTVLFDNFSVNVTWITVSSVLYYKQA